MTFFLTFFRVFRTLQIGIFVYFCMLIQEKITKVVIRQTNRNFFAFAAVVLLFSSFMRHDGKLKSEDFPKPQGVKDLLFYVQRTFNTNTLIYTLNTGTDGELVPEQPIKAQWINYAKDGKLEGLNYIQRKFAYGLETELFDADKKKYKFNFVSYKKQPIFLVRAVHDNQYHAYTMINNEMMIIHRIYIQIEGGSFWLPNVKYIEITGTDAVKNKETVVRVIP
jgi:hypothetical protein